MNITGLVVDPYCNLTGFLTSKRELINGIEFLSLVRLKDQGQPKTNPSIDFGTKLLRTCLIGLWGNRCWA
jgi:hypothetical protein